MKRLSGKRFRWQARDTGQTGFQKRRQMALGSRRTGPLYGHGDDHLADCRALPPASDYPLEYVHFFHLATKERSCQAKPALGKAIEGVYGPANPSNLRKSG